DDGAGRRVRRGIFCADFAGLRVEREGVRRPDGKRTGGAKKVSGNTVRTRRYREPGDSRAWRVRSHLMLRTVVPPGKSDAGDPAFAGTHGQGIVAGEHVHSGKQRGNGMARGALGGGSELDRYCAVSERGVS